MRAILLILILAVVALIAAFATGYLDIAQTREASAPQISANDGSIRAKGGQTPAFEVQKGSVEMGTREADVPVPKIEVKRDKAKLDVPAVEIRRAEEAEKNAN